MAYRLCYRTGTAAQTTTVLGDAAVTEMGAAAHTLPDDTPGLAYLVGEEGGKVTRLRSYWLDDPARALIADRCAEYRREHQPHLLGEFAMVEPVGSPRPDGSFATAPMEATKTPLTCPEHRDGGGEDCPLCHSIWQDAMIRRFASAYDQEAGHA